MAKSSTAAALAKLVRQLQEQRQEHLDAVAEIEASFKELGISIAPAKRRRKKKSSKRGRPKASRKKVSKKRVTKKRVTKKRASKKRFKVTAGEFITVLLKKNKKMTTKQINGKWKQAGRGGRNADNTLSKMTEEKKILRKKIKGGKGSEYRLPA